MKFEGKREKLQNYRNERGNILSKEVFKIILYSCKRKIPFPKEKERVLHHHPVS